MKVSQIPNSFQQTLTPKKVNIYRPSYKASGLPKYKDFLREDKLYFSFRNPEHFFRKYNGFGLSAELLLKLVKQNCRGIVIIYNDGEQQTVYTATAELFLNKGIIYLDGNNDYQRILSLEHFKVNL